MIVRTQYCISECIYTLILLALENSKMLVNGAPLGSDKY